MTFGAPSSQQTSTIRPVSSATAEHYGWGEGCDGWHLLKAAGLSVIEERMPAGTAEIRHWHPRARQFFYVRAGTLTLEVEGVTHVVHARHGVHVPPGVAHQARNHGDRPAEFLVISEPPSQRDRLPA
jgi:mannose-6-phosphate isomerase-like protein (cupin superfamily)